MDIEKYIEEFDARYQRFKIGRIYDASGSSGKLPVTREAFTSEDLRDWLCTTLTAVAEEAEARGEAKGRREVLLEYIEQD